MSTFLDGPAAGVSLLLHSAPEYLRVVHGNRGWDALDQEHDRPTPDEDVHVYRRTDEPAVQAHACGRGWGGWYELGDYRHVPDVRGADLRETRAWRAWVAAQEARAA